MKRFLSLMLCIVFVIFIVGCDTEDDSNDKISIVVTAFPHYDFARQITKGVDNVEIEMLIPPGSEVHTYEPGPSDILAISSCDIFIYTGGESDTWAKSIVEASENKDIEIISFMDLCADNIKEHEKEHEGHGHVYDEHVWTSPINVLAISKHITQVLTAKDEKNARKYKENYEYFLRRITEIIVEFENIINQKTRTGIVVADRFPFYHLAHDFGFEYESAYSGCSQSTEPSAHVLASLSEKVRKENIPYVFTIEFSNRKIARSITEGTDASILTLHSCHNVSKEDFENGTTYYDLMMQNAENLRKALCE